MKTQNNNVKVSTQSVTDTPFWVKYGHIVGAFLLKICPQFLINFFLMIDRKVDGAATFFFKHWGKSRFMISMSKKAQYLGIEKLFLKSPKAFVYFFLFYLVRDTILYIILPIWFAKAVQ